MSKGRDIGRGSGREIPPELAEALTLEAFPRSATYDPTWMLENHMGPCALWLTEALGQVMDLQPGQRVLDLGCGDGWSHWLRWLEVAGQFGYPTSDREAEMVRLDAGRTLGFTRVVAHHVA